jgi:hypothetical protein
MIMPAGAMPMMAGNLMVVSCLAANLSQTQLIDVVLGPLSAWSMQPWRLNQMRAARHSSVVSGSKPL